jgi:hypothetical protein
VKRRSDEARLSGVCFKDDAAATLLGAVDAIVNLKQSL